MRENNSSIPGNGVTDDAADERDPIDRVQDPDERDQIDRTQDPKGGAAWAMRRGWRGTGACMSLTMLICCPAALAAGPSGGQVTAGNGTIAQNGNGTLIDQQSQNLAIDWTSFSIGSGDSVRFVQPDSSAIALNRVVGQDPSTILGSLQANGQIFILDPNGVLFGKTAQVDVGALAASTLNLSDADFQAGDYHFTAGSSTPGTVLNLGRLTAAPGGYLAMLGPKVTNDGSMSVIGGTVLLAAGNKVSLQLDDGSLLSYSIDLGALDALAENDNLIQAGGGRVYLTAMAADSVAKAVVNNTGVIEAQTVENQGGVIRLLGDPSSGQVNVGGTLDASAPNGGNGGTIETSAAQVKIANDAHITTAAADGQTGSWLVDPTDFTIAPSGGDITGATLSTELGSTSITLSSSQGSKSGNGDIFVDDTVSWSANTTLTLTAARNIQINDDITATGNTAGLVLNYGSGDNYYVNGAKVTLSGSSPSLSINGQSYTVINSLGVEGDTTTTTLQGMNNDLSGNYALGSDLDASATSGWTGIQGLVGLMPIGSSSTPFTGQFAGLGHVISNLTVEYDNNSEIGLFGETGTSTVIRDVGLSGGTVIGTDYVGSLIGINGGTVLDAYSNLTMNDQHYLGGLVGENNGTISGSYDTGTVTSKNKIVGGLVGLNNGTISDSYATGTVTAPNKMLGGLVGENGGTIEDSYSTGQVGGTTQQAGGLVGYDVGTTGVTGTVTGSFWDETASGQTTSAGGTGMTTAAMQTEANFTSATAANGNVNPGWDFTGVWTMYSGSTYPLLRGFLQQITVTANNVSATYTSSAWNGSDGYTCSSGSCSGLLGTVTFGGTAAGAIDVGTYSIVPSGLSSTQYAITFEPGQLTITPALLAITGLTADSKVYDGTQAAVLSGTAAVEPFGTDSVTVEGTGTGLFASKNVGTDEAVTVSGYTLSGSAAGNYTLVEPTLTASITPASLAITGLTADSKVYDATTVATLSGTATVTPFSGDSVALSGSGTGTFASKNVGTEAVTVSGFSLTGTDAGNYTLVDPAGLTANITPAPLAISGLSADNKVYDATTAATLSGTATVTALAGDSVTLEGTGTGTFASKDVGTEAVTVTGFTLSGADASNYALTQPTGLTANITPAPLTVTGLTADSKVYNATTAAALSGTATVTPFSGDSVTLDGSGTGTFASKDVGTQAVTVSGFTITGSDAGNYTLLEPVGLTASITPDPLAITGLSADNKVYDSTTAATLSGTGTVTPFSGDSVALTGTGTGTFASKNVGTQAVSVSGFTLTGTNASDYTLVEPAGLTASITPAQLAITGLTADNKVYDGTTSATLSGTAQVTALGSDSVTLEGAGTGTFASKNVGTEAVTVSGFTLSGADSSNYTLLEPTGLSATITPASLTITGLTANNKVYDATTNATLSGTATVTPLAGDIVTIDGTGTGTFASKDVGTGIAVTVSGFTLGGTNASDYTLEQPTGLTASITPAPLAITGLTANSKVYDATTAATLSGTAAVTPFTGDSVTVGGTGTGTFASKDVGTQAVAVSGFTLTGTNADDYTLVEPTGLTASITPAPLAITGLTANSKVYDATTDATLSGTATVAPFTGDSVTVGGSGTGTFASKDVGTQAVTVSGFTLTGADAGNYTLTEPAGLTASITPAPLAVTGLTADSKVYDATTTATLSGTATVTPFTGDSVTVSGTGTGTLASKNVGTEAVTVSGFTLTGTDAGDYSLVEPTGLTASITPASLSVGGVIVDSKVYDGTTTATLTGFAAVFPLGNDSVTLDGTGTATFASKNVGTQAVTVGGFTITGADAGNYTLAQPTGLTANITPAPLAITGLTADNKVYDATTTATLGGTATVAAFTGDSVTLDGTGAAAFASKNVGTQAVTVSGYTLTGADAGNYTLEEPTGLTASITPAPLAITGLVADGKVYDTTTTAALSGTAAISPLGEDNVVLTGSATGAFADKNVGSGIAVTVSGYSLTGADAGNYTLVEPTSLTANITPADLSLSGVSANNKVYDATLTTSLSGTPTVTALGSDSVSVSGTGVGTFGDKNVGSGKAVTVSGYSLTGADAGNYELVEPTGLTADITPAPLAITGLTADNKVYDATTAATLGGTATVTALGGDSVSLEGTGTGTFASKNVGTGEAVTVSGYALSGTDAGNYTLVEPTGLTANITPAPLAVTGLTADSKVYDATTDATLSGTAAVTPLGSDSVSLGGTGVGTLASKNVGTEAVTVSGFTLTGADAGNYTLVEPTGLTASITPADLILSGISANNKVYDGTVTASLSGTPAVTPLANDSVSVDGPGVGTFSDQNAGSNKAVTVSGYTLTGADAGNYTLVEPTGLTANITAAPLTITANGATDVYSGAAFPGGNGVTYSGFVNDETASVLTGTLAYGGSAQRGVNAGSYSIIPSGLSSSNYAITFVSGTLTITPAPLTITANSETVAYSGTAFSGGDGVTYSGFVASQTASVLGGTLTYGGSSQGAVDAGTYAITPGGLTSTNYAITFDSGTLTISPAAAAAMAIAVSQSDTEADMATSNSSSNDLVTTAANAAP